MNKMFFKFGLGLLATVGLALPSGAAALTGMKTLPGHVPPVISSLAPLSQVNSTNELHLSIGLPLRNQDQLKEMVQEVADPASPNYRHYLSTAEFTTQFGPTEADVQAVQDFATSKGLRVVKVHGNRMLVEVAGKASDVENAFNVTLHTYHLASENRDFYAPDQNPSIAASLPVLDIQGLDSYNLPKPKLHYGSPQPKGSKAGSSPGGSYMGYDFRSAYVPGTTLTGTGQSVALLEFDGYYASDITLYEQRGGLPSVTLTNILLGGFSGFPFSSGGQGEVTLDIDMVVAMAPGVDQVLVYEGNPIASRPNDILNQIAVDNSARQISSSWGWGGGPSGTTDQIFQQMILQGQTYFNASGDSCAFPAPGNPGSVDDPYSAGAPSDSPYITQVGATTLKTTGAGGPYASESVWNWVVKYGPGADGIGSSGGISGYYTIPTWQQGVSMASNQGSTTMRNTPDVTLTGDDIFIIQDGADQEGVGGTSCAAPLWAAFIALVNQQSTANGGAPVGFINPALYALGKSAGYTNYFHDVVIGDNTWSQSPNEFYAVPGYDLCAGWGSPNGTNLIFALAGKGDIVVPPPTPVLTPPAQPWGNSLANLAGTDPNGLWLMFIQDDTPNYKGTNYNGWMVNLTSANPVGFPADNQIFVSATNISVTPGSQWVTTLSVTNYGPATATNVIVTDTLPDSSGVSLLNSFPSLGGSGISVYGGVLTWNLGTLPANTGTSLALTFRGDVNGVYTNGAVVNASTTDPNSDDDVVGTSITIAPMTPPAIVPHFYGPGSKAFSLSITNDDGATVIIQASTNLVSWLPIATNIAPFSFTNFDNTNFSHRFYRALIPQ